VSWYTAECLFRAIEEENHSEPLLEVRYFLLKADDGDSARTKALEIAKAKQHGYLNMDRERVDWRFERLLDTKEVLSEELREGTEVYYKYISSENEVQKL
jgi:Domain of unknown function (DUF4288)